ncbi:hypothetical protein ACJJTC_018525 [Scirpophaga incertulas]
MHRGKKKRDRTEQTRIPIEEDAGIDLSNDNCSETSGQSDTRSNQDEAAIENETEKFEEKVMEVIDNLSARSAAARASSFTALHVALQRRFVGELLTNQRATLADHVTRALRRGRDAERRAAAALAPLLALQIGEDGYEDFLAEVRPVLTATAVDRSASIETRTEVCSSLAVLCYLLEEDITEIIEIMKMYETIFSGSYLKGDGSVKVSGAAVEEGVLHAAALDGWALLLALLEAPLAAHTLRTGPPSLHRLADLLAAHSIEVRVAGGGALCVAYEQVVAAGEAEGEAGSQLLAAAEAARPRLQQLARESHKYRAKRDRKVQRATFRDILQYFDEEEVEPMGVRVGAEQVWCSGWGARAAYGALAGALGGGLAALLPHAAPLRHALRLPRAPPQAAPRPPRLQRHLQNSAASKARTLARNKSRDKRCVALAV